ncbi:MAG: hypothetical protein M0P58_01815 [Bacteroidales bacterium]|nr:hypothetical protein [Bacteroidales bacterium]
MIGSPVIMLERIDSTNAYAMRGLETNGWTDGAVILARDQFAGCGQHDHKWHSEPGKNLTFTLVLHPVFLPPDHQFLLNKAITVAVLEYIRDTVHTDPVRFSDQKTSPGTILSDPLSGIFHDKHSPAKSHQTYIKWPNDIYLDERKVAGILIENRIMGTGFDTALVGVGVNINQLNFPVELPNAGSLAQVLGHDLDMTEALKSLCKKMDQRYNLLRYSEPKNLGADYCFNLKGFGQWGKFTTGNENLDGKIKGVDDFGRLIIELRNGKTCSFNHKEIEFV